MATVGEYWTVDSLQANGAVVIVCVERASGFGSWLDLVVVIAIGLLACDSLDTNIETTLSIKV